MIYQDIDISENEIWSHDKTLLHTLLRDNTTGGNIIWATRDYEHLGAGFGFTDPITVELITGANGHTIRPRVMKTRAEQTARSKDKAEVFTPAWICNAQNNLVDNAWFGRTDVFNTENADHTWNTNPDIILFPTGRTWQDYVTDTRLEITCGEAPYIVSRYDASTGEPVAVADRIGLLDRKLRVVSENTTTPHEWTRWALKAVKSTYGYEWQGDSLLLAREAALATIAEHYATRFGQDSSCGIETLRYAAYVIAWNIWQMDGLKCVIPGSCHSETETDPFGHISTHPCRGCQNNKPTYHHNGIYPIVRDWGNRGTGEPSGKKYIEFIIPKIS